MTFSRAIDGFPRNVDRNPIFTFFFRRIPAHAFGMMRIAWASVTALYLLFEWQDVVYYYSEAGILPQYLERMFIRQHWHFTVLDYVTQPFGVTCIYVLLLAVLVCTALGIRTRASMIASIVLLFSFHERNTAILGGGDTLLRNIGFILMITPGINALSIDRAKKGWALWKNKRAMPKPMTMPVWGWRLLLWQMIAIYATSFWTKMLGEMWRDGTAIQVTLHHPTFSRFPFWFVDHVLPTWAVFDKAALYWQGAWLLLLIPVFVTDLLPSFVPRIALRRILIGIGILFHLSIFILMDAGVFSLAVFVAYIGLLRENDVQWLKNVFIKKSKEKGSKLNTIVVLYDGHCGLCLRSMYSLELCDWLKILKPVDFRVVDDRRAFAPGITESKLDKAMHIRLSDGSYLTGFDAFRYMTRKLPPLWPAYPLLWLPGVDVIGRKVYARIAESREKCDHENCAI